MRCPHCGSDLDGGPIPAELASEYPPGAHWGREIGVEVAGVYDGTLYWECPDCHRAWARFAGQDRLGLASEKYVKLHNLKLAARS